MHIRADFPLPPFPTGPFPIIVDTTMGMEQRTITYHYLHTGKRRYRLRTERTYTIGRNPDCDIFLSDPTVSRSHAHLVWDRDTFLIRDDDSTNGIYLNGDPVTSARLSNNDKLTLGKAQLIYSVKNSTEEDTISPNDSLIIEQQIRDLFSQVKDPGLIAQFREIVGLFSAKKKSLHDLAYHDNLTGLLNRRSFDKMISDEWKRRQRYKRPLSLIMIDIDHFKKVNDRYGHQRGDSVLKTVAGIILDNVRSSDYACRYGGEEIAVILPETSLRRALVTAEKLRTLVEKQVREIENIPVTISLGVGTYLRNMKRPDDLIAAADRALYRAKKEGRNRVIG